VKSSVFIKSGSSYGDLIPRTNAIHIGTKMARQLVVDTLEALKNLSPPTSPKSRSPSGGRFNFRKSLQKRSSKMTIFTKERSSKTFNIQPFTDEMIRLETVLMSQKGRQLLIQDLLTLPGNHSVKVRFVSAVDTFDSAESKEDRQRLGLKIVETFIQKGGLFTIDLPQDRVDAIVQGNHDVLLQARKDVLDDLASKADVMKIVEEIETMEDL